MKWCCERSPANLPLSANPLEEGGICLLCCRGGSAVVQTRLFSVRAGPPFTHPPTARPLPHHPHIEERVERMKRQGLVSHGSPVLLHINEVLLQYTILLHVWCVMYVNVMKRWVNYEANVQDFLGNGKLLAGNENSNSGCVKMCPSIWPPPSVTVPNTWTENTPRRALLIHDPWLLSFCITGGAF